jgi:hypothetical protein
MLFSSISSEKYKSLNKINEIPILGTIIVFVIAILPTVIIQDLIQLIIGEIPIFETGFMVWFNTLCIHLFILRFLKIKINLFLIPSWVACVICMGICYKQILPYI